MKLFFKFVQETKIGENTVDKATWKSDLDTESKTVTTLLKDLKERAEIDEEKFTLSDEKVLSGGKEAKKTDKVETLNTRDLVYQYTITQK